MTIYLPNSTRAFLRAGTGLLALAAAQSAFAQDDSLSRDVAAAVDEAVERETAESSAETVANGQAETNEIVVTARHREERAQDVPVALSVISGDLIEKRGDYTLASLQQVVPSLQLFSTNSRNTTINIRGLGSNVATSNDRLESGVGFYIDGVYYSRPGQSQFDLIELERVEVLRGPQGTLFGKNTTAGAISVTTRAPSFQFGGQAEASTGNFGLHQVRGTLTGPLTDWAAFRVSLADTHRYGYVRNLHDGRKLDDYDNFTARGQLLLEPAPALSIRLIGDYSNQTRDCCARPLAGVVSTYDDGGTIANNFDIRVERAGYVPPSLNPFDRIVDVDAPVEANMNSWGLSGKADLDLGPVTLTSISAYRKWNWYPRNDADWIGLQVNVKAEQANHLSQFSQELRVASNGSTRFSYVAGAYYFWQITRAPGATSYGADAPLWLFPAADPTISDLAINGFEANSFSDPETKSYAVFGQSSYQIVPDSLTLTVGLRYTHEKKRGSYRQWWVGGQSLEGLSPADRAAAEALRNAVAPTTPYDTRFKDSDISALATLSYDVAPDVMVYATYARGAKSGCIPTDSEPAIEAEKVDNYEAGIKSQFWDRRATLNAAVFHTSITDYQTQIYEQLPNSTRSRLYLANIPKARARGFEVDGSLALSPNAGLFGSVAYSDARYIDFKNGPTPVEALNPSSGGSPASDLSGRPLSGTPEWSWNVGGDAAVPLGRLAIGDSELYVHADYSWRSSYNTSVQNSRYTQVPSYGVANVRLGLRLTDADLDASIWAKNVFDTDYVTHLSIYGTGVINSVVGEPRTFGVTLRARY